MIETLNKSGSDINSKGISSIAQRIKHNINEKYATKNKQTTSKIPLGSTCSVTNHDNEMKFQP